MTRIRYTAERKRTVLLLTPQGFTIRVKAATVLDVRSCALGPIVYRPRYTKSSDRMAEEGCSNLMLLAPDF